MLDPRFFCSKRRLSLSGGPAAGLLLVCLTLFAAAGCDDGARSGFDEHGAPEGQTFRGDYPIQVTCTTGMVAELVRNVGGQHVAVATLMGPGVDPHLYKASPGDVRQLSHGGVIFYSGLHLEGKMSDLLARLGQKKPALAVAEQIDSAERLTTAEGVLDPHVWFDVSLWSKAASYVCEALMKFDPPHAADYARNAERYLDELNAVHRETQQAVAQIPAQRRVLVTAHDAFHYFGRAYGIEVRAIQGINTESEAGVREINALVEFLVDRKLPAVFVESSVSDRNVRALVEGCEARGHHVAVGGELYSDALGSPNSPGATYIGMVRHNVETIVQALR